MLATPPLFLALVRPAKPGLTSCAEQLLSSPLGALFLPKLLGAVRGVHKHARDVGFMTRGEDGLHTTDDPRIYKVRAERKYPHYKQRRWSKPYLCTDFSYSAPRGSAVKLAIFYVPFEGAEVYYSLRRALEGALPGAQIMGVTSGLEQKQGLVVRRVCDGRILLSLDRGDDATVLQVDTFTKLVHRALDCFEWRYGVNPTRRAGISAVEASQDVMPNAPTADALL